MEDLTTLSSDKHSPEHFQINMRHWDYYMMMQKLKNDALWCKSAKNSAICIIYEASINLWCDLTTLRIHITCRPIKWPLIFSGYKYFLLIYLIYINAFSYLSKTPVAKIDISNDFFKNICLLLLLLLQLAWAVDCIV